MQCEVKKKMLRGREGDSGVEKTRRRAGNGTPNKKAKFPDHGEGERTKVEEKESTFSTDRRRLRRTKNGKKESRAYKTSEENAIWNLQGQNEGPLLSALHTLHS